MGMDLERLEDRIRHLASEGMGIKRDLLPLYADQEYMGELIRYLAEAFRGKVDCVCAPEPMGLIVGSMLAHELGIGLVVIHRNSQFLIDPDEQVTASYINHRDKVTTLFTERSLLPAGSRVLLADDWVSTAATLQACVNMIEDTGCKVAGIAAIGADNRTAAKNLIDSGTVLCAYCGKE